MDKNFIEKRIREKAEKRFENLLEKTNKMFDGKNLILAKLKIYTSNDRKSHICLGSHISGYCPGTDLFNNDDVCLLEKHTNFKELKEKLISEFEKEATDMLLGDLAGLRAYLSISS